jgi:hypothetical protein
MIWARCRGGNPLGASRAVGVGQQPGEPFLLVTAAETPDGGRVALPPGGDVVERFASSHGQNNAGPLDLEEGQGGLACDALQAGEVTRGKRNRARFATAHGEPS